AVGYKTFSQKVVLEANQNKTLDINLEVGDMQMNEVVVTGTLKEVNRLETPVPVEVYNPTFFKMNPTPSVFEAMQNVNGVRPQMNCNVCNTGDIHINGLEGPYTMVLIDGMPIVSGLSSVYGLFGIPNAIIQRVEVVKGPASSLYGSEAVGGLINVITKNADNAPVFSADVTASSWQEYNTDLSYKFNAGSKASVLTGINYFNYSNPIDNNGDGFTDLTLQDRLSIFQKWNFNRKNNRLLSLAGRYMYEDRWGGQMQWSSENRGGDQVYGESIYTERWEVIGNYQLPVEEKMLLAFSYNNHDQNSYYGDMPYFANQKIAFSQLTWDKTLGNHDLLFGSAIRYTFYDDNTAATSAPDNLEANKPDKTWLPGIFAQDNIKINQKQSLLLGLRYDQHSEHGGIWTPRLAYKLAFNDNNIFRINAGTGFRVVNLFTEEHAALTGAREVEITEELNPEQSYNVNLNYIKKIYFNNGTFLGVDASAWYTYFENQILPDYETDPNKIIYDNLNGHAITQGVSINFDVELLNGLKLLAGTTFMDVYTEEEIDNQTVRSRPLLTERWSGTWGASYTISSLNLGIDYTGNFYSPMKLPVLGENDPRPDESPWWSIQNIKLSWTKSGSPWEIYGGVKNLLNFTPADNSIFRAHDPFDRNLDPDNPNLTFDPSYVYTSNQGIRGFLGLRYTLAK
ncbi:TonB-dependent receptor, partial [Fulvivirga sp. RKSG066]|uniref:TonB-dependent receptor plug domain-containing protein n=1 Tax=Fulvivirga aurantia TaxID=2529383 RepID=UPI0012BBBC5C